VTRASGPVTRALVASAVAIAALAFAAHAVAGVVAGSLDCVSGIWLALGRDTATGHFYRPLLSELGYGGTRYFPLFFILIAALTKSGAGILTAGWLTSALSAVVLASGMYQVVRRLDGDRRVALLFGAAAIAPYFVQQTLIEIRADVLAAALNVWGLAFVLPAWRIDSTDEEPARATWAAVAFTLAIATKVTSLGIPIAVIAAAVMAGRGFLATAIAWRLALLVALFLALVSVFSGGHAMESWRACMFAGGGLADMFRTLIAGDFLVLTRYSRLLAVLLTVTIGAVVSAYWRAARHAIRPDASRSLIVPVMLFLAASLSAALLLSSPGTVPANHIVEWIEIALVVIAVIVCTQPALARGLVVVTAVITLWASAQDVRMALDLWRGRPGVDAAADVQRLVRDIRGATAPVLSESAVWPLVAGREVYLLDPFALRVVMAQRDDIARDLIEKIDRQAFPLVILQADPTSEAGRGYYAHLNFGAPVIDRVLARYALASHPRADAYVYVPRPR
jgi:hypothetical protein